MNLILFIPLYLLCNTAGLMLLKTSITGVEFNSVSSYTALLWNIKFILGFALYATSFLTWILILSRKEISYIYPMVIGLSYIFVMTAAILILKENFTIGKFAGAVLVGLGIIVMTIQK